MIFAGLSYTCAFLAMAVLAGYLLTRHRESDFARRVALVSFVSAIWAGLLAFSARYGERREWVELGALALRYAGWLFALSTPNARSLLTWMVRGGYVLCGALFMLALVGGLLAGSSVSFADPSVLHSGSGLLLACAGLVLTEQVVRNAPAGNSQACGCSWSELAGRWPTTCSCFTGAAAGLDGPARPGHCGDLVVAGLALPVGRRFALPASQPRVFVSRHVVFYTSAFVAVGLYLCLMALGGYFVRHSAAVGATPCRSYSLRRRRHARSLLLSDSPLRRLRVFISTHFYRNKYDYRVEWLRFVQTLSPPRRTCIARRSTRWRRSSAAREDCW